MKLAATNMLFLLAMTTTGLTKVFGVGEKALGFPENGKDLPPQKKSVVAQGAAILFLKPDSGGTSSPKNDIDGTPPLKQTQKNQQWVDNSIKPQKKGEQESNPIGSASNLDGQSVKPPRGLVQEPTKRDQQRCIIARPHKVCEHQKHKPEKFKTCKKKWKTRVKFCQARAQQEGAKCENYPFCFEADLCCLFSKQDATQNPRPTMKPTLTPTTTPAPTCAFPCKHFCIDSSDDCCGEAGYCEDTKCWLNQFDEYRCIDWNATCVSSCGVSCLEAGEDCCDDTHPDLSCTKGTKCWTNKRGSLRCIPSNATVCSKGHWCSPGKTCCGNSCLDKGDTCCDDTTGSWCEDSKCVKNSKGEHRCISWDATECSQDRWCVPSEICCGSSCCPEATSECCNGNCMPKGSTCCPSGDHCPADRDCYKGKCFPKGVSICPNDISFCSNLEQTCCKNPKTQELTCYSPRCPLPGVAKTVHVKGSENIFSFDYPKFHKWCNLRKYRKGWRLVWDTTFTENIPDQFEDLIEDALETAAKECVITATLRSGAVQAAKCILTVGAGCAEWVSVFIMLLKEFGKCVGPNIADQLKSDVSDYIETVNDRLKEAIQIESYEERKSDITCHWPCSCWNDFSAATVGEPGS